MKTVLKALLLALLVCGVSSPALAVNAPKIAQVAGSAVPLPSYKFVGMAVGTIVQDTTAQNWQLTTSTATVNHTSVEACAGAPQLRWLTYSGGGGGGAVSSVSAGSGCATVSPTTGAVIVTSTGCLANSGGAVALSNIAAIADQRILGNVSGGSAAPIALTAAQVNTFLGTVPSPASTGLAYFTTGSPGTLTAITTLTGLAATSTSLTNTLMTGVSGGQTIYGDTLTTGVLTVQPNFADTTTGRLVVKGIGVQVGAGTTSFPSIQFGVPGGSFGVGWYLPATNIIALSTAGVRSTDFGNGYIQFNATAVDTGVLLEGGNAMLAADGSNGIYLSAGTFNGHQLRLTSAGNVTLTGSLAIANTLATPASGTIVTTNAPSAVVSLSLKYINMQVGGVTTYVLALQ